MTVAELKKLNGLQSNVIKIGQVLKLKSSKKVANIKKKAPVKSTAKNVKNTKTKAQAIQYINSLAGKGWDYDGYYGWQCFDLVNVYWHYMFGHGLKGVGAKDIPTWNDFSGEATIHKNTPSFLSEPGDLAIWTGAYGNGYGHVAIVLEATLNNLKVVEQNWLNGGANKTEVATIRNHPYETNMWFVRPIYK